MFEINVYIDGACSNNGQKNAKAGYGVYFGENDQRNANGPIEGKQSNNTGELTAFIRCLEILQNDIQKGTNIHIHTDSEYVMKCATTYGAKLEKRGWKSSKDKEVPNLELVQKAYILFKNTKNVTLNYIKAHTANTDLHSVGNAGADRLANEAANISGSQRKEIVKLNIPFANKDKAKELGAKWNINKKYWYINSDEISEELLSLQIDTTQKIYLSVPFAEKDKAKKHGAKWDASVKKWYYIQDNISQENEDVLQSFRV